MQSRTASFARWIAATSKYPHTGLMCLMYPRNSRAPPSIIANQLALPSNGLSGSSILFLREELSKPLQCSVMIARVFLFKVRSGRNQVRIWHPDKSHRVFSGCFLVYRDSDTIHRCRATTSRSPRLHSFAMYFRRLVWSNCVFSTSRQPTD
jgi:hypothetical protein